MKNEQRWYQDWSFDHKWGKERRYTKTICGQEIQITLINYLDGAKTADGTILHIEHDMAEPRYLDFDILRKDAEEAIHHDGVQNVTGDYDIDFPTEWFGTL